MEEKLKVMYIAPRLHPNQCPILSGWISDNNKVCFLVQHEGHVEDHSIVAPIILGQSKICNFLPVFFRGISDRDQQHKNHFRSKNTCPPISRLIAIMNEFEPDILIVRDRSLYMLVCYWVACFKRVPVILYNQTPLYSMRKRGIKHVMFDWLFPKYSMTPVWQRGEYHSRNEWAEIGYKGHNSYYIPFVMAPHCSPKEREYFWNDQINILEIGRYEKRKNHFHMLDVVKRLIQEFPKERIHLHIVGECANDQQSVYKSKLTEKIKEEELCDVIELFENLNIEQMDSEYKKADLFILPSSGEPASISPLEAMSYSLACVSGDDNGTADYIIPGQTGEIYHDGNWNELYIKLSMLISDRRRIRAYGEAAYQNIKENYCFEQYKEGIYNILDKYKK